ncbi:MAG: aspartate/glutamate racemase family protein [Alphaproteobacteria bacterium]
MTIVAEQTHRTWPHGGAVVGVLLLDTKFPRVFGDGGNSDTFPFPVLVKRVQGATPFQVVDRQAEGLLEPFVKGAHELVAAGAAGITTTCGFLAIFQRELAQRAGVPVAASSIIQVPLAQRLLPAGKRVGIITADSRNFTARHLEGAGLALDTPVIGTETGTTLTRVFTDKLTEYRFEDCEADLVNAGRAMLERHPDVGAFVLECTNMPPFAGALERALGLPVYDFYTLISWFHSGLKPTRFPRHVLVKAADWQPKVTQHAPRAAK